MKKLILIFLLATLAGCSTQQLKLTSSSLIIADWTQTRYIADNPQTYHENNPILGKHPSEDVVNIYFAAWLVGNLLVDELPINEKTKTRWYWLVTIVESALVAHNNSIGIGFKF